MNILKYGLLALAVVAVLFAAAAGYLIATFDPADFDARVIDLVREKTGRTLSIEGPTRLSFWPDIGIEVSGLALTERDSSEAFARVEGARMTLELKPLLAGAWVASEVVIRGAAVRIERFADGRLNIDDLLGNEGGAFSMNTGRLQLEGCELRYVDAATGAQWDFSNIALQARPVAQGVPAAVVLKFAARDAAGTVALKTAANATVTPDFAARHYGLEQVSFEATGSLRGFSEVAVNVTGGFAIELGPVNVSGTALVARMSGTRSQEKVRLDLSASEWLASADDASARQVKAALSAAGAAGTMAVVAASDAIERKGDTISVPASTLEVDVRRGVQRVQAAGSARIEIALEPRRVQFAALEANVFADAPRVLSRRLAGAVRGEAKVDLHRQDVALTLAGRIDQSAIKAQLSATGFAAPVYTFAVHIDALDLDRYGTPGSRAEAPEAPDFSSLARLPASGTLRIGTLKTGGTKAKDVELTLKQ
ncbi:MAG: AsmA family protein [Burkholderiales bacterium]